jgi:hypothetical protein
MVWILDFFKIWNICMYIWVILGRGSKSKHETNLWFIYIYAYSLKIISYNILSLPTFWLHFCPLGQVWNSLLVSSYWSAKSFRFWNILDFGYSDWGCSTCHLILLLMVYLAAVFSNLCLFSPNSNMHSFQSQKCKVTVIETWTKPNSPAL